MMGQLKTTYATPSALAKASGLPVLGSIPEVLTRDPRVARLFAVGVEAGTSGRFVAVAEAVEKVLPGLTGRDLRLNVSAAIPAVLLDVGFPPEALKGVPILARCAGLIGHLTEELSQPIGFALSYQATREQRYTGALPAGVTLKGRD